ncbi:hypothetical protein F5B19DRAFT_502895 [Rostrohypoxylon terebratum]|nr:hypothetical protein F5B19DRAFT_502895 [Rostrohypoxylon terebratum]
MSGKDDKGKGKGMQPNQQFSGSTAARSANQGSQRRLDHSSLSLTRYQGGDNGEDQRRMRTTREDYPPALPSSSGNRSRPSRQPSPHPSRAGPSLSASRGRGRRSASIRSKKRAAQRRKMRATKQGQAAGTETDQDVETEDDSVEEDEEDVELVDVPTSRHSTPSRGRGSARGNGRGNSHARTAQELDDDLEEYFKNAPEDGAPQDDTIGDAQRTATAEHTDNEFLQVSVDVNFNKYADISGASETFSAYDKNHKVQDKEKETHSNDQDIGIAPTDAMEKLRVAEEEKENKTAESEALRSTVQELTEALRKKSEELAVMSGRFEEVKSRLADLDQRYYQEVSDHRMAKNMLLEKNKAVAQMITTMEDLKSHFKSHFDNFNNAIKASNNELREVLAEKAQLNEWKLNARLTLEPLSQGRDDKESNKKNKTKKAFDERESWALELSDIMRNLLTLRPIVHGGSSMTPDEFVRARRKLVEKIFGTLMNKDARNKLRDFLWKSDRDSWYCFKAVVDRGYDSRGALTDDGDCMKHNSCILIKHARHTGPNGVVFKNASRRS